MNALRNHRSILGSLVLSACGLVACGAEGPLAADGTAGTGGAPADLPDLVEVGDPARPTVERLDYELDFGGMALGVKVSRWEPFQEGEIEGVSAKVEVAGDGDASYLLEAIASPDPEHPGMDKIQVSLTNDNGLTAHVTEVDGREIRARYEVSSRVRELRQGAGDLPAYLEAAGAPAPQETAHLWAEYPLEGLAVSALGALHDAGATTISPAYLALAARTFAPRIAAMPLDLELPETEEAAWDTELHPWLLEVSNRGDAQLECDTPDNAVATSVDASSSVLGVEGKLAIGSISISADTTEGSQIVGSSGGLLNIGVVDANDCPLPDKTGWIRVGGRADGYARVECELAPEGGRCCRNGPTDTAAAANASLTFGGEGVVVNVASQQGDAVTGSTFINGSMFLCVHTADHTIIPQQNLQYGSQLR